MLNRHPTEERFFQAGANLLEWPLVLLLTALNILFLTQSAATGAEPMLPALGLCAAMILLHALWQLLDREPGSLRLPPLLQWLLPLWLLAGLHLLALSPATWEASHQLTILSIATIAFWISATHLQKPWAVSLFLLGIISALLVSLAFAVLQVTIRLQSQLWVLDILSRRLKKPLSETALDGVASGTLAAAPQFAALLVLTLPALAVFGLATRFRAPVRIALLGLIVPTLALLFAARDAAALGIGIALLLIAPLVGRSRDQSLPKALLLMLGICVAGLALGALLSPAALQWASHGFSKAGASAAANTCLWQIFLAYPLTGAGIGNLGVTAFAFGKNGPACADIAADTSGLLSILASSGAIGAIVLLTSGGYILTKLFLCWRKMPLAVPVETENLDRSWRRYCQPLATVTTGAMLLALGGFALLICFTNPLGSPALVVLLFSLLGLAVRQLPLRARSLPAHKWSGIFVSAGAMLLCAILMATAVPPLLSRLHTANARAQIDHWRSASIAELLQQQDSMLQAEQTLRKAIRLDPANVPARTALSRLLILEAATIRDAATAKRIDQAVLAATRVLEIHPQYLPGWFALAEARQAAGQIEQAQEALQHAIDHAPQNADCWYNMAILLKQESGKRKQALAAATEALRLSPHNPQIQRLQWQLMIP